MHGGKDRFLSFLLLQRALHTKRWRFAAVMALFIAILSYQTQWLILRPGLTILLTGQAGVVFLLLWRNAKLSQDLNRWKAAAAEEPLPAGAAEEPLSTWFEAEEKFVKRLAIFETICQMVGFVTLGYEIWVVTRSLLLALAIGVVYPATSYFGITRVRNRKAIRQLRTEKRELTVGC